MVDEVVSRSYCCFVCRNYVAEHADNDIVSKSFQAHIGRTFWFSHAVNIVTGPKEERHLICGLHTVADVFRSECGEALGWKYVKSYEPSQTYKEGNVVR